MLFVGRLKRLCGPVQVFWVDRDTGCAVVYACTILPSYSGSISASPFFQ